MQPTLLVLAAGMGSRYGGLKQLDSFGPTGETILEYSVYDAIRAGFGKVVFVIREDFAEAFHQKIGDRFADRIDIVYVYQEMTSCIPEGFDVQHRVKPWGTGHAVLVAKDVIDTPFTVINADDYCGISGFEVMAQFLQHDIEEGICAMVGYTLKNTLSTNGTVNRGVCEVDDEGMLISVQEWHKLERRDDGNIWDMHDRMIHDDAIVSINFWGFMPSIFHTIEEMFLSFLEKNGQDPTYEFYIPSVVNNFICTKNHSCKVIPCDAQWSGVTYEQDKQATSALLEKLTLQGMYPSPLWQ